MEGYILLVDDDADDRLFFLDALKIVNNSWICKTVNNGLECLHFLNSAVQPPLIIFSDINMPLMDGRQLVQQLKGNPQFQHIPIVIMSTTAAGQEADSFLKLGADHFIHKPDSFTPLVSLICEAMQLDTLCEKHEK